MTGVGKGPILVTGASGGIGAATVRQLVAAGAEVIACGRNVEQLRALESATGCRTLSVRSQLGRKHPGRAS